MTKVLLIFRIVITVLIFLLLLPFVLLWAGIRWLIFRICFVVNARKEGVPLGIAVKL